VTASAASAANPTLNGAGSTLIAPLEQEWQAGYQAQVDPNVNFNYQAVGSGTGLKDIAAGQVDFGASDAPLSASSTVCNGCVQMPWALTATGIGIHINGMRSIHLTGTVMAEIYVGQITKWNDHRIQKLQKKGVHLPNLTITPVFRSDGSGDTYAFTDYESKINGGFASQIGNGTTVRFQHGIGALHNSGMISALQGTNGAIAYVAVSYLASQWPRIALVRNAAGRYEAPNYNNIVNAAQSVSTLGANNEIHIVNPPARYSNAFPISTYTYVIVPTNAPQGSLLQSFIGYAIGTGQSLGPRLDFVPIPGFVKRADQATLSGVH
jgi:phosphate transport system substrate-binding protein